MTALSDEASGVCIGGLDPRDLKTALLFGSFLRKGEVLAYVGRIHNLKDLKGGIQPGRACGEGSRDPLEWDVECVSNWGPESKQLIQTRPGGNPGAHGWFL